MLPTRLTFKEEYKESFPNGKANSDCMSCDRSWHTATEILWRRHKTLGLKYDFTKAFDTIHRGKMIKILRVYGIPNELVEAIEDMYQDTTAKVRSPDGETKPFKILSGVLQGDTLAPYLFIIVLDYALRKVIDGREEELGFCLKKCQSRRVGPEILTDLDFADDIALLSEQIHQAQNLLNNVEVQCGKIGLKINAKKTKSMVFNHQLPVTLHTLDGSELEIVQDFRYLGSLTQSTEADIKNRKAAAWKACNKLKNIWKAPLGSVSIWCVALYVFMYMYGSVIDNSEASLFGWILYYVEVHYKWCPHADGDEMRW